MELEMLALQRAGNSLEAGLLPTAAGFAILKDFITANDAGIVQLKVSSLCRGPEHEGRVAITSPGDRDGTGG